MGWSACLKPGEPCFRQSLAAAGREAVAPSMFPTPSPLCPRRVVGWEWASSQGLALRGRTPGGQFAPVLAETGRSSGRERVWMCCSGQCGGVHPGPVWLPPGQACLGPGGKVPSSGPSRKQSEEEGNREVDPKRCGKRREAKGRDEGQGVGSEGRMWGRKQETWAPLGSPSRAASLVAATDPCPTLLCLHQPVSLSWCQRSPQRPQGRWAWTGSTRQVRAHLALQQGEPRVHPATTSVQLGLRHP